MKRIREWIPGTETSFTYAELHQMVNGDKSVFIETFDGEGKNQFDFSDIVSPHGMQQLKTHCNHMIDFYKRVRDWADE